MAGARSARAEHNTEFVSKIFEVRVDVTLRSGTRKVLAPKANRVELQELGSIIERDHEKNRKSQLRHLVRPAAFELNVCQTPQDE